MDYVWINVIAGMTPNLVENCCPCIWIDSNFGPEWGLRNCRTESGFDRQEFTDAKIETLTKHILQAP